MIFSQRPFGALLNSAADEPWEKKAEDLFEDIPGIGFEVIKREYEYPDA